MGIRGILNEFRNVPNLFTLFRLLSIPFMVYIAYKGDKLLFGIWFLLVWLSDVLDGAVARGLHQETKFGAKFDSFTDDISAFFLFVDLYLIFPDLAQQYWAYVFLVVVLIFVGYIFRVKRAESIGIHLLSSKLAVGVSALTVLWTLLVGFNEPLFWICILLAYFSNFEIILVTVFKKNANEKTRSLFF